jgi:hypothetical protein
LSKKKEQKEKWKQCIESFFVKCYIFNCSDQNKLILGGVSVLMTRNRILVSFSSICAASFLFFSPFAIASEENAGTRVLTNASPEEVTPFAEEEVGGGTWSYGTKLTVSFKKRVYSNYFHKTDVHGSAAKIGAREWNSSCAKKDTWSKASQIGSTKDTGLARWNKSCKL